MDWGMRMRGFWIVMNEWDGWMDEWILAAGPDLRWERIEASRRMATAV